MRQNRDDNAATNHVAVHDASISTEQVNQAVLPSSDFMHKDTAIHAHIVHAYAPYHCTFYQST